MKLILKNSQMVFAKNVTPTGSWVGIEESTIEAFTRQYSADKMGRGLIYDETKRIKGIRFYVATASSVNIYTGQVANYVSDGYPITLLDTVTTTVGWNEYIFDTPLPLGYGVVLNGAGVAFELAASVSTSVEYTMVNTAQGMTEVTKPICKNASGTVPGIRLLMV